MQWESESAFSDVGVATSSSQMTLGGLVIYVKILLYSQWQFTI